MPKRTISFETVRTLGLALPEVEEGTAYGSPALKTNGQMFTCIAVHRSAEPDTLAIRVAIEDRDELIVADPKTYYLTDHYVNYPVVLVRLAQVSRDALRDLLHMGHRFVSAESKRGQPRRKTARKRQGIAPTPSKRRPTR